MRDDDIPLAQFAVAFEGASWTDPDSIALMVMQSMLGSWNKSAGGGKHMGYLFATLDLYSSAVSLVPHVQNLFLNVGCSSELAQRVGINEIAESMMAFNTNYKDTGLFGVYAVAKVGLPLKRTVSLTLNLTCCLFLVLKIRGPFIFCFLYTSSFLV